MKKLIGIILLLFLITLNIYLLIKRNTEPKDEIYIQKEIKEPITYKEYFIGDIIIINDEEWRVIKNSSINEDYVTLINTNYTRKINNCFKKYIYLTEKKYFEGEYLNKIGKDKTKEIYGYKIRLITLEEYDEIVELTIKEIDEINYNYSVKYKEDWVKEIDTLTMTDVDFYYDLNDNSKTCISWYIQGNIRQVLSNKEGFISIQPVIHYLKEYI
ncbi:MAG: hypothetical protein GX032_01515 [Tenericutes bacterium]|nr:hypothetical protein [Mycoplasmatota bacterium]